MKVKKVISTRRVYGTPQNTYITQLHTTLVAKVLCFGIFFLLVSGDIFILQTQNFPCLELLWTKSFPNKCFQCLHKDLKLAEQVCLVALIESLYVI